MSTVVDTPPVNDTQVVLLTSDGQNVTVSEDIANMSVTVKNMREDLGSGELNSIPLVSVDAKTLNNVLYFLKHPMDTDNTDDDLLPDWANEFLENLPQEEVFGLILAANYMDITGLLDTTCKFVANQLKGKSVVEIREMFNIKNDFTPEEEDQICKENSWCEET